MFLSAKRYLYLPGLVLNRKSVKISINYRFLNSIQYEYRFLDLIELILIMYIFDGFDSILKDVTYQKCVGSFRFFQN